MKTFRIYAQIVYKDPQHDEKGFPENPSLNNPDPAITIHNDEMHELVAEIKTPTESEAREKIRLLAQANLPVLDITITD